MLGDPDINLQTQETRLMRMAGCWKWQNSKCEKNLNPLWADFAKS